MVEIKEEYNKTFKVAFADDIKKNYSGNTSKILLALIKGICPKFIRSYKFQLISTQNYQLICD